jgi:hypothetical protein
VTEAEWNACTEPQKMLEWLRFTGEAAQRKRRLFAVACCRHIWPLVPPRRCRKAVEVAEGHADGVASEGALLEACEFAIKARHKHRQTTQGFGAEAAAHAAWCWALFSLTPGQLAAERTADSVAALVEATRQGTQQEKEWQAGILRDIFGNPFRPLPPIAPSLLTKNDGLISKLAQAAYNHRDLPSGALDGARLAVLADALDEASCTDPEVLAHFRSPGPHVRGCFALDAILGKS